MGEKEKKQHGIAEQIMYQIGRVVVAVIVIVAIVSTLMVRSLVNNSKEKELTLESAAASYQIAGFFDQYIKMTEQLAVNPQIQELLLDTKAGESILDQTGYPTVFDNLLEVANTDKENIMATWIADLDANMVTQSDKFTSGDGWEITERVWYVSIQNKMSILTEPYVDASTGTMILSAVAPVYDNNGNVLGVAGMDISMEHIMKIMPQYKIGKKGYVMLLSADGLVIYHPDEQYVQKYISDIDVSKNVVSAVESGSNEFLKYDAFGATKYGYVSVAGDTGYIVVSNMPSGEYFSQMYLVVAMLIVLFVAGMVAIILAMRKTAARITKPILVLNETAQKLAEGDLDVDIAVTSQDEIGKLGRSIAATVSRLKEYINYIDEISSVLDAMSDGKLAIQLKYDYVGEFDKVKCSLLNISSSMREIMMGIAETAHQVSAGADDLAEASQNLAEGAGDQAAAVQELVATTTTVVEQVEESRADAEDSAAQAVHATRMIEGSQQQMNQMMDAMKMIQETSQKVVGIIATIEEIADQTNLLSLNASIEAARAGEAGRGFAVVASEIGSLADESAHAANTTRELIGLSMKEIERGTQMAEEVLDSLRTSVSAIEKVNQMIRKTADNAGYQAQNMEQIRIGIEEISNSIQDNSAMAEESSATSEELAAQSTNLNEMVERFELD